MNMATPKETYCPGPALPAEEKDHTIANIGIGFSVASLMFFPLFLGLAGFVLGIIAIAKGDTRGVYAVLLSIICPILDIWISLKLLGVI